MGHKCWPWQRYPHPRKMKNKCSLVPFLCKMRSDKKHRISSKVEGRHLCWTVFVRILSLIKGVCNALTKFVSLQSGTTCKMVAGWHKDVVRMWKQENTSSHLGTLESGSTQDDVSWVWSCWRDTSGSKVDRYPMPIYKVLLTSWNIPWQWKEVLSNNIWN